MSETKICFDRQLWRQASNSRIYPYTHPIQELVYGQSKTTACEVSEFCAFLLVAREHESISVNLFHAFITLLKLHTFNNFHYIKNIQLICHISNNTAPINSNLYNGLCFKKNGNLYLYINILCDIKWKHKHPKTAVWPFRTEMAATCEDISSYPRGSLQVNWIKTCDSIEGSLPIFILERTFT